MKIEQRFHSISDTIFEDQTVSIDEENHRAKAAESLEHIPTNASNSLTRKLHLLGERQGRSVLGFLEAINGRRPDITEGLKKLKFGSLIFVGENSPFYYEALHMTLKQDRKLSALVEVQECGSMVTEERPDTMVIPLEYFLMGFNLYRPSQLSLSPRSPLSPRNISHELFSPESMGWKLKPINRRIHA